MPDSATVGNAVRSSMLLPAQQQNLSVADSLTETQQNCRVEGGLNAQACIPVSENASVA